jgi:hypothetical protein
MYRGSEHRGNSDDYPHMVVELKQDGSFHHAHISESADGPHRGTRGGELSAPSYNDPSNFEEGWNRG